MQVARRIKGNIEMPDGKPCGGAYVAYLKGDTLYEETYTGADGAFQLRVASPDGVLRVSPPSGYATEQFSDIPVAMEAATEITLRPIRLREIPRLKGRVLDADGQPVVNAIITTPKLPDPARFLSGEEGRFEFVPSYLPEGGVVLFLAEHPERFEKVSFLAEFGTAQDIEVRLEKYEPQPAAIAADAAELPRPLLGEPAPDWTVAKWFNTDPLTVKRLGGKVVVVAFWGSFDDSPQGVDALQTMALLGQAYANDDSVEVVGIHDATSTEQEVQAFIEHTGLAFPVGLDSQRFDTFTAYKVTYIPEIVLIDKKGKVRFRQSGEGLVENLKLLRRE
jgi:peroxiredoxin